MPRKLWRLIWKNTFRSRTRLAATTLGCTLAAFVTCFFLASERSVSKVVSLAAQDANIVVRQKDRH
jgi:hypothetical protein